MSRRDPVGPSGLMYVAEDAPTGYGVAGYRMMRALRSSGIMVQYRTLTEWRFDGGQRSTGVRPRLVPHSRDDRDPVALERPKMPRRDAVAAIIPALGRPGNVAPLVRSFKATAGKQATLYFVCDADDTDEIVAVAESGAEVLISTRGSSFSRKVNSGYEQTTEPWLFVCGDDVRFRRGWIAAAREMSDRFDVIGTNDSPDGNSNPRVASGAHADHFFIRRAYVEQYGGCLDGLVCHEGYRHLFADVETVELAKARRVFAPCLASVVEHLHPERGKAELDDTYRKGWSSRDHDQEEWRRRAPLVARQREAGNDVPPDAPTVAHLVPEHYGVLRELRPDGPLIGHTVWETDRVPVQWVPLLNGVDRLVVPSEWNRDVFRASGVTPPISVVPHVACEPVPGDESVGLAVPDELIVFYTISVWDERKAPWTTLRAFLEAFTADDPVVLVVKTGQARLGDPFPAIDAARLFGQYRRPPRVQFALGDWTEERVASLHARGDCFVSLTHGEGWGLGAFDACAYGNPVVITGWGGPLEYLRADASFLVDYDLVPVCSRSSSYTPDQRWAQARLDHAVELLRAVAADPAAARRRAAALLPRMRDEFAGPAVARRLVEAIWGERSSS